MPYSITNIRITIFLFCTFFGYSFAQTKFDTELLKDHKKNGQTIAAQLQTIELPIYSDTVNKCIYLKNGFRSSKFLNEDKWLSIKDTVEPYRVDIVYSKYPLRNGVYNEIYPLLFDRLKRLFQLDPGLNDAELSWNKVLQTNCINDAQVNSLFHGVVIWYKTAEKETITEDPPLNKEHLVEKLENELISEQNTLEELNNSVGNIMSSSFFPDSLKKKLSKLPLNSQIKGIKIYLEKEIANSPDVNLKNATETELKKYGKDVEDFLSHYKVRDNVVTEVFNRHPEWKNILVVNDWTGSMYGYGAQVLQWHVLNFEKSGIYSLTLFNDGDSKPTERKRVGSTGGIYSEKADNIPKMVKLFNYIMLKGGGGDGPENDIEGILTAMENFPSYTEIVLIADNNACVRDIELADRIGKPVRVIICGYEKQTGVNPDYVYLAKITGGGIYTLEDDIENINAELGKKGEIINLLDTRFKIKSKKCSDMWLSKYAGLTYTEYKFAARHKRKIRKLQLEDKGMVGVPKKIFKMKKLNFLDLSGNEIKEIPQKINKLEYLKDLDLSHNKLSKLPRELRDIHFIETINLSYNDFSSLPGPILGMKFLLSLNLSHNDLSALDRNMNLRKLEVLDLSNNKISEIPNMIGNLRKLKNLDLSNNSINFISNSFVKLNNLETLNLSNNQLTKLPNNLSKLNNLKTLNLQGNAFSNEEKNRIQSELIYTKIYF